MSDVHARVPDLLDLLTARDTDAALALVLDLADRGTPVPELLTDLLGPAQIEVGRRWHRAAYNVADEHAATAIVDTIVSVLRAQSPPVPVDGPKVTVVCAEGEWHLLPARLVAEVLRGEGFAVTFLGASMPPAHLARFLETSPPDVLAVSCTTAMSLDGVLVCASVAHNAGVPVMACAEEADKSGVPVIAGGSALGPDDPRARVLGVDLWAPDLHQAVARLRAPLPTTFAVATADVRGAADLARRREAIVDATLERMVAGVPDYVRYDDAQQQRTREDLAYLVDFARAGVLTRDPRVLLDVLPWLEVLLDARGVPTGTFRSSLRLLAEASEHPAMAATIHEALART